jgi:hypothetical protein
MFSPQPSTGQSSSSSLTSSSGKRNPANMLVTPSFAANLSDASPVISTSRATVSFSLGREDANAANSGTESGPSGHSTPNSMISGSSIDAIDLSGKRAGTRHNGRERGVVSYTVEEHIAMLAIMKEVPDSFTSSESSEEWKAVYEKTVEHYYVPNGSTPRLKSMLHGHFIDMYSAFKQGIRALSLTDKVSLKCPSVMVEGEGYLDALLQQMLSNSKRFHPKKWSNKTVLSMLLDQHICYATEFSTGEQNISWMEAKTKEHKGKFQTDQKNREAELARKRAAEEEEQKEAAKYRKMIAESSLQLTTCLERLTEAVTAAANPTNITEMIDNKFAALQQNMMANLDEELDSKFTSFLSQMHQMMHRNGN